MAGPKYDAAIDAELTNDPVFMGYVGWSGTPTEAEYQAIADLLNDDTLRDGGDAYVPTHVFMGAIKPSAWPQGDGTAAVDEKARAHRDYLLALTSGDIIDLGNLEIQSKLTEGGASQVIFAGGTAANLRALWATTISRAQELGIPRVRVGDLRRIKGDL